MFLIMDRTGGVIHAAEEIKYAKTQANGAIVATDAEDATTVYCGDNDTFYALRETIPGEHVHQIVEVEEIPQGIPLKALKYEDGEVTVDIATLRTLKLAELSVACQSAIYDGVNAETTEGEEHFSLTINDQTNIGNLAVQAQVGANVLYHADGKLCRVFVPNEMLSVAVAAVSHKTYHTTLCNHMNVWARRSETVEELTAVAYGVQLPDDLAENMAKLLAAASGEQL